MKEERHHSEDDSKVLNESPILNSARKAKSEESKDFDLLSTTKAGTLR